MRIHQLNQKSKQFLKEIDKEVVKKASVKGKELPDTRPKIEEKKQKKDWINVLLLIVAIGFFSYATILLLPSRSSDETTVLDSSKNEINTTLLKLGELSDRQVGEVNKNENCRRKIEFTPSISRLKV